jgi:DNA-binding beta-propeller fold protein YncE
VALLAALATLLLVPAANAADTIYWGNEGGSFAGVRLGNLGGGGGAYLFAGETPCGVAINPAAGPSGQIYWANWGSGAIRVGNLDGTGAQDLIPGQNGPCGVAIDPTANKIYWASYSGDTIRVADLDDGSPVGDLFVPADGVGDGPSGVAIDPNPLDPAGGKIYWTTQDDNQIQVGNLDGTGSVANLFIGEDNPIGVAIDPAGGTIYWANCGGGDLCSGSAPGTIRRGDLDGTDAVTLFDRAVPADNVNSGPAGVAIDPTANKIYWATFGSSTVQAGNLDGTGSATQLFGSPFTESFSNFPALLRAPVGSEPPAISGAAQIGKQLTCSQGGWAPDLLGAFLYRAPHDFTYEWLRDGNSIAGANQATFTPTLAGSYTCRVTASNRAGSASQESAATTVVFTGPISLGVKCQSVAPGRKWLATMNARTTSTSRTTASGGRIPRTTGQVTCTVLKANPDTALFAATNLTPPGGTQLQGASQIFTATATPGPAQIVYTLSFGTASITMTFKLTVV